MSNHVDLDALLALDEELEPKSFTFRGQEWLLPGDPPIGIVAITDGIAIWRLLIDEGAEGQLERFDGLRPRVRSREMNTLDRALSKLYGLASVGESSASVEPSVSTGDRSRPTSNASTGSISDAVHGPGAEYRG